MGSCGDAVSKFEGGDPSGLVAGVAVGDVVCERAAGGIPVGVIGVVEHELLDGAAAALDPSLLALPGDWSSDPAWHTPDVCTNLVLLLHHGPQPAA